MKKMQIFVSSTYEDLKDERQKMVEAILDAGHIPAGMEIFGGAGTVIGAIKRWIDESDIYFLLLGGMYGSIYEENSEKISFTEWEYRYACSINKPVCAIILDESMLHSKAAKCGRGTMIFEEENKEKYEAFKRFVLFNGLCKFISNISEISGVVQSDITKVLNDDNYNLVGWVRGDSLVTDWNELSDIRLKNTFRSIFESFISRCYNDINMTDFSDTISSKFISIPMADGILNSFHRITKIYKADNGNLKVDVIDQMEYRYLSHEHRGIGKKFQATKYQAETYTLHKLLINNKDYTSDFKFKRFANLNRGKMSYYVQSEHSIEVEEKYPISVYNWSSYECPPEDFFQSYGLPFPCKSFMVDIVLMNNLEEEYDIIVSTHSAFSKNHADSFEANEVKNLGECNISLPEWSLAGDGYTVSIQKKAI